MEITTTPEDVMARLTTTNAHDNGYDLTPGNDVTNPRLGTIAWDSSGLDGGLVLRIDGAADQLPDDAADAFQMLANAGYELDAGSIRDVEGLGPEAEDA